MIVNSTSLRGIYTAFNTLFNQALTDYTPLYEKIAMVVPSTTGQETYAWLGDLPNMREWIGEREINNLTASDYTIKNKDFEATISLPRNAIEDDQIGLYSPAVKMLGESAAQHPDQLVFELVAKGFTAKCYDGQPFFSDDHPVGKKKYSNKSDAKLTLDAYIAARTAMMSLRNSKGVALNLVPDTLLVPPALEKAGRDILVADFVDGTKNTMQGTAELLVAPQLAGNDTAWYLLVSKKAIKAFIYQQRKKAQMVAKTNEQDDNVFFNKAFLYGADARGNVGYGLPQLAYGSTGTA